MMHRDRRHGRFDACRAGASLVELLAAMTAASVVMSAAVSLVHRGYALESRSRQTIADERTALRLARQLRADVHAADRVRWAAAPDEPWLIMIDMPLGTVTYATTAMGLERIVKRPVGMPSREDFTFSRQVSWVAHGDGPLVSLSGTSVADRSPRPPLVVDIAAALAPRAKLVHGGEP